MNYKEKDLLAMVKTIDLAIDYLKTNQLDKKITSELNQICIFLEGLIDTGKFK